MIVAAAACAAAGISYIFNDVEQPAKIKSETVTVSSTIIDQQGILKYIIYPRSNNGCSYLSSHSVMDVEQKNMLSVRRKDRSNQLRVPLENKKQMNDFKQEFSIVFFWSIPLKARLLQTPTKSVVIMEDRNPFQYYSMKISIGTQSGMDENLPSKVALSNSNDTLDSLSYNPMINDHFMPMGIMKKNKLDLDENKQNEKKFCFERKSNEEQMMRDMITKNVNLCVENLSKILSESCSNTLLLSMNNHQSMIQENRRDSTYSKLCNHHQRFDSLPEENLISNQFYLHKNKNTGERSSDGVILHRGEQFGIALGEAMVRKFNTNGHLTSSSHSIDELNRLFSTRNCFLMQQYQIESIEDLIRLFLQQGEDHFTELMINLFQVNPLIVEQLNIILLKWAKQLT